MRQTIELLRKQSIQAGLTQAHMQSMGVQVNVNGASAKIINGSPTKSNGQSQNPQQNQNQQPKQEEQNGNMQRQHSTDSMCSVNSNSSQEKKKKKGWVCLDSLPVIFISVMLKCFLSLSFFFVLPYSFEAHSQKLSHVMPK